QALQPFLQRQRWFASKSRKIRQVRFTDWTRLRGGTNPAFLALVSVEYADGWVESYQVPLALVGGAAAGAALRQIPSAVLARITGARKGAIVDGMIDDDACDALLQSVADGTAGATVRGSVQAVRSAAGVEMPPERRWARGPADQSNSVAFVSDRYVLKLF